MKMIEAGRLCIKTAGRDAGKLAVIIKKIDNNYVLIDGFTRRKKCNIRHIELLNKTIKADENTSKEEIIAGIGKINGQ
ncbi:50S ribosomal protein L14e [archaeon]|nr:50S ribosomal protein L14e [archaeon]